MSRMNARQFPPKMLSPFSSAATRNLPFHGMRKEVSHSMNCVTPGAMSRATSSPWYGPSSRGLGTVPPRNSALSANRPSLRCSCSCCCARRMGSSACVGLAPTCTDSLAICNLLVALPAKFSVGVRPATTGGSAFSPCLVCSQLFATTRRRALRLRRRGSVFDDHLARLFAHHVDGRGNEKPRDPREHRRVDDPQPMRAVHPEAAVDHGHAIVRRSDLAGARSVMPPGVILDELADLLGGANFRTGHEFFGDDVPAARGNATHDLHALHDRGEVLTPLIVAFVEIMEVDRRHFARIRRA